MAGAEVWTARPDGTAPFYLGTLGHVGGLAYDDTMPGGAGQLTCTLQADPAWRHEAISPGRRVVAVRGASLCWEGTLTEPVPSDQGWNLTADGAGTWGSRFRARGAADAMDPASVIDAATGRGLRWIRGSIAGAYTAQTTVKDPASINMTDYLNGICSPTSYTWRVHRVAAGLQLDLIPIPAPTATPTRILVATVPQSRTLAGYVNALYARYKATADSGGNKATYLTASATWDASIARHDRFEDYWDLTSAGVISGATATGYLNAAMQKYVAATWSGPFTVSHGRYLTNGGAPVDLACEHAGEFCRLILADGPYGGEVSPAPPVVFPVGKVAYSDDAGTLTVTPFAYWKADWQTVLNTVAPKAAA